MTFSCSTIRASFLALGCVFWLACARNKPEPVAPLPRPDIVDSLPEGATLALRRPTPGVAKVALWVRAGSRHADPPALATATAFWVEAATRARARVLPDATELSLPCDTRSEGLERCIEQLARAFAVRAPSAEEAGQLRDRLRAARQRARADDGRQLDLAVMRALVGAQSRGLDPLGDDADDVRITPKAIAAFLGAHYASDRSVLIAAGDVDAKVVARGFARTRRAASAPAKSPQALTPRSDVAFLDEPSNQVAAALATPSVTAASALAAQLRSLYPRAVIRVIPLRTLPVLTVRIAAGEQPLKRVERLVFDLRRLALEGASSTKTLRPDESLDGLVRELGESWAARSPTLNLPTPWPLGIALGAAVPVAPSQDSAKLRAEQVEATKKAVERGEQLARGTVEGELGEHHADVQVENGARITVQRRPGDRWVAATIRLSPGSAHDPVTRHGRAALLATLLADGCGQPWGSGLAEHLSSLDARLEPFVEPASIGLSITAPAERSSAALEVLLRCALSPELSQRAVENARVRLLGHLERAPGLRFSAHLAHMLAPQAPGVVAPWGTPFGVAEVPLSEIRRLHAESTKGARVHVWVAADGDPERLAKFIARRLARLEKGPPAPLVGELGPVQPFGGELTDVDSLRVVIGLRAEGSDNNEALLAPQVFANALRDALGARLGRPLWSEGAVQARSVTAGVALALEEAELPRLDGTLRNTLNELCARRAEAWRTLLGAANYQQKSALSSALGWTQAAARGRLAAGESPEHEQAALERLCRAAPTYWVLRPRP